MKVLVLVLGALAALTFAAAAGAKGLPPSQICGATECVQLDRSPESAIILDHDATTSAPPVSGYYRVAYAAPGIGPHLFVPSGSRLAVETAGGRALQWYALYGTGPERLRQVIRGLEPLAPPAKWPDSIEVLATPAAGPRPDEGFDFQPWVIGALPVLLALFALTILKGGALKKLVTSLFLIAVGLVLVAAGSAKGPVEAQICGVSDCVALDPGVGGMLIVDAGDRVSRIPPTADFFRVDFTFRSPDGREENSFSHLDVPSRRLMAAGGELPGTLVWFPLVGEPLAAIEAAVAELDPFAGLAAWPTSLDDPVLTPAHASPTGGRDWLPYALAACGILVLLGAAVFARRIRLRQARTA